ncbi:sugar/nucleoside kinase (ribokinase family) [Allocatelliglobosispora scoriae]|uniref:Sugar/nucleoside kinase (Ribokinase family) n=1 Tax=Allocatelliglobosispora scoriae TaxID=643052 RepID=A0A841BYM4_9ACTN|nr:PfkB family carbohydrate kinase [Allocatelliglobosispora scoriae]MBB5873244.1 sugar/nucleoside kinase (ribokinase family) [Allocatelliglobosispora scoriae]
MRSLDVLVIGGAGVDTIVYVPELPLPYADSYLVPAIEQRAGQTGDGVALGLHALGLRVHLIDLIGDDHEGRLVRELHERHGVPFTAITSAAGTKRAVNLVDPAGRRLSLYDISRGVDDERFPIPVLGPLAADARHVHLSITHPGAHAIDELLGSGATLSTDLHDWDGVDAYHEAFAYAADLVFLSTTALDDHEAAMRRILMRGRARAVIATAGAEGAYLLTPDHPGVRHVPVAPLPAPAVDSNGAGDAFVAGFLFGWLGGASAMASARYGAVAGAHACGVPAREIRPIGAAALTAAG